MRYILGLMALAAAATPAAAHHSFAMFDMTKTIAVSGTVSEFRWTNPHAWLHLDAPTWDWLPGAALVQAAGGATEVFTAHGHRWHVAGNRRAVAELSELVRRV